MYPLPFDFHTRGHIWNPLKSTDLNLTLHLRPCCATLLPELNIWSHAESRSCRLKQLAAHIPRRFGLTARCEPGRAGGETSVLFQKEMLAHVCSCAHTTSNYPNLILWHRRGVFVAEAERKAGFKSCIQAEAKRKKAKSPDLMCCVPVKRAVWHTQVRQGGRGSEVEEGERGHNY